MLSVSEQGSGACNLLLPLVRRAADLPLARKAADLPLYLDWRSGN